MNNDLISREALKKDISTEWLTPQTKQAFYNIIDNAPTVRPSLVLKDMTEEDIENFKVVYQRATSKGILLNPERPHGKWVNISGYASECSICKTREIFPTYNFCPNCGAQMDKEGEE